MKRLLFIIFFLNAEDTVEISVSWPFLVKYLHKEMPLRVIFMGQIYPINVHIRSIKPEDSFFEQCWQSLAISKDLLQQLEHHRKIFLYDKYLEDAVGAFKQENKTIYIYTIKNKDC